MGKKDNKKKKGMGALKTAAKTEKKLQSKRKKALEAVGEDDIEKIVAEIEKEEQKSKQVVEKASEPPSRRLNFTFVSHPDKDELILFGGEYFNGQKTFLYNDLFFYNISNNTWTFVKAPAGPPPRCGHQMVVTSANKGQLWVFGGEFASPTQTQFYHYRDLWVYHLQKKQWEKIASPNGPSARSGHRMVYFKKQLIVFGGFHDNTRDYKYFNDVYSFNTETYEWSKLEPTGTAPAPRSGVCMLPLGDKILVHGGYSKEQIKKELDEGHVYSDSFLLTPDKNDPLKWKWSSVKLGGVHFPPRCGMPITSAPNNTAYCFGGVFDVEDEECVAGTFFNDTHSLDLDKLMWRSVSVMGKKNADSKSRRRKNKDENDTEEAEDTQELNEAVEKTTLADDGVFKVTLGPTPMEVDDSGEGSQSVKSKVFQPSSRMNAGLAIKHNVLYLYGGMFEEGDKQITFSDMYALDLKKLEEWKVLISDDTGSQEWLGSESESETESEEDPLEGLEESSVDDDEDVPQQ